jgi:hypothetical protein
VRRPPPEEDSDGELTGEDEHVAAGRADLSADQHQERVIRKECGDPKKPVDDLLHGAAVGSWLVVDPLVPRLQDGWDSQGKEHQEGGSKHGQGRHRLMP